MSDTVISVENVSKQYRLGTTTKVATSVVSSGTLSHDLNRLWARVRGKPDPLAKIGQESDQRSNVGTLQRSNDEFIWALRDASFEESFD